MAAAKTTEARVWRSPLPVLAAALACFLVVFVLLTARVVSGRDPALQAGSAQVQTLARGGHRVLRTTASGRVVAVSAGEAPASTGAARPITRSSSSGEHDG